MATYTDNYTMTKPTYAEQADISVINANMDIIDNVMHSSQISLAPAYDINETYNTGDIVMHELLMYKCLEDNVTGAWDSTKWTRTTAGEESGGGADLDIYGEASGTAEASFSDGAEASLVECIVEIEATQSGSGTPSPSNVRPIVGRSEVNVSVEGKNKYIGSPSFDGYANISTYQVSGETYQGHAVIYKSTAWQGAYKANLPLKAGVTYTFSAMVKMSTTANVRIYMETSTLVATAEVGTTWQRVSVQITPSTDISDARIRIESVTGNITIYLSEYMLEEGSEATPYEPYITPEVTNIPLGRTVYGGTLDVTRGILTVDKGYLDLSNLGVTYYKSAQSGCDRFYTKISDIATGMDISGFNNAICDYFDIRTYQSEAVGTFYIQTGWINIQMPKNAYDTGTAFKTWIESESVHLVYELATPQTYTLTPTQVLTLLGQNYVSHDGGGTISLVYIKGDAPIKPNPAGAEIPLTGIEIDGEKFSIPQKGQYTETTLWEGSGYTESTWTLSDDFRNYDALCIFMRGGTGDVYTAVNIIPTSILTYLMNNPTYKIYNGTDGWYQYFSVSSPLLFTREDTSTIYVNKIIGIKYNG